MSWADPINDRPFVKKSKGFLLNPKKTFELIKEEKIKEAIKYFIWITFLYGLIVFLISSFFPSIGIQKEITEHFTNTGIHTHWVDSWFMVACGAWFAGKFLILALLWGIWLHTWIFIIGRRKGIKQTFKVVFYSITPILFGSVIILEYISFIWILFLQIQGIRSLHGLSKKTICVTLLFSLIGIIIIIQLSSKLIPSHYFALLKLLKPF